jgi:hypothetical protein
MAGSHSVGALQQVRFAPVPVIEIGSGISGKRPLDSLV